MSFWKWPKKTAAVAIPTTQDALRATEAAVRQHLQAGQFDAARDTLADAPDALRTAPELELLQAELLRKTGQPQAALELSSEALITIDRPALAQLEIAECHLALADVPSALDALNIAVTLSPELGTAWQRLGEILRRFSRFDEALSAMEKALPLLDDPHQKAHVQLHIGMNLFALNKVPEAVEAYQQAIALEPDMIDAHTGLGHAYLLLDEEHDALTEYEWVHARESSPTKHLLLNLGSARQHCGQYAPARELFERVMAEHPNEHLARWYLCQLDLLEERWAAGWANYGARFGAGASPYRPLPFRLWDGKPIPNDTLLVLADQGLGDEIMFASCLPDVLKNVGHVVLECEPRLQELYERSFPGVEVIGETRSKSLDWLAKVTPPQWQIPCGDLPALFRRTANDFPNHTGYLKADPDKVIAWRARLARELGPGLKVGLSWRGGTDRTRSKARSVPLSHWRDVLTTPGAQFINLQYGDYQAQRQELMSLHQVPIQDFPEAIADYDETAALVSALDVVVTVCTSIVHLAGALGRPVWVLTPHSPGWRYTAHGNSLPWYPSSRIFRQPVWGDWSSACQELSTSLRELTLSVGERPIQS